jgi:hypothetical protein
MSKTINNGRAVDIIYKKAFTVIYTKLSYDYGRHVGIFFLFLNIPVAAKKHQNVPLLRKFKRGIFWYFLVLQEHLEKKKITCWLESIDVS